MILSQRYPAVFDGIISGDPAMRTGLSNLAIGKWIPVAFNQIAPKDAEGKPIIAQAITDTDRKMISDALLQQCDAKDGVADGIISDPLGCDFDPAVLACKEGKSQVMPSLRKRPRRSRKPSAVQRAAGGSRCIPVPLRTGITAGGPIRGILSPGPGIFGPATTAMEVDVEKEALANVQPLVDSMSTNLTTFSGHGGKLIFLSRQQRSLVLAARYIRLLQRYGGREWRAGSRFQVEPVLFCSRNGALRRRSRA